MSQRWNKTEDKQQPLDIKSVKAKQTIPAAFLNTDFVYVINQAKYYNLIQGKRENQSAEIQQLQMKFLLFNCLTAEIQQRNASLKLTN